MNPLEIPSKPPNIGLVQRRHYLQEDFFPLYFLLLHRFVSHVRSWKQKNHLKANHVNFKEVIEKQKHQPIIKRLNSRQQVLTCSYDNNTQYFNQVRTIMNLTLLYLVAKDTNRTLNPG